MFRNVLIVDIVVVDVDGMDETTKLRLEDRFCFWGFVNCDRYGTFDLQAVDC